MYIDNNGTAVADTPVTMIVHEMVHALTGRLDDGIGAGEHDRIFSDPQGWSDYKGATVNYANIISRELGYPEQNSYIAQDFGDVLTLGFQYTNGVAIDRSVVVSSAYAPGMTIGTYNWNSSPAGDSNDLLIGDGSRNTLIAGHGNDFLYGMGSSDRLEGGGGYDRYYVDRQDKIMDSDGFGNVTLDGEKLGRATRKTGETDYRDEKGNVFSYNEGRKLLTVNKGLQIENYTNGDLEIVLVEEPYPGGGDSMALTVDNIQKAYIAFFHRPADLPGLDYWRDYPGNMQNLLAEFADSAEYRSDFDGLNNTQIVGKVYQNLFGRAPDHAGSIGLGNAAKDWLGTVNKDDASLWAAENVLYPLLDELVSRWNGTSHNAQLTRENPDPVYPLPVDDARDQPALIGYADPSGNSSGGYDVLVDTGAAGLTSCIPTSCIPVLRTFESVHLNDFQIVRFFMPYANRRRA
jgi:hypothetical protein